MIEATLVDALKQLRIAATTVAATTAGLLTIAAGRGERTPVTLASGDLAPDFTLIGSDGATYHLADFRGRHAVVTPSEPGSPWAAAS